MKNKISLSIVLAALLFALNTHSMQLPEGATEVSRVAQVDGKTLVLAKRKFVGQDVVNIYRYNTNNELDDTFGTNGWVAAIGAESAIPQSIEVQPDGKILVKAIVNEQETKIRFNSNGMIDFTFGVAGYKGPEFEKLP